MKNHHWNTRKTHTQLNLPTLGYADVATLLGGDISVTTTRVTSIAQGSREDADMEISIPKTEVMYVCSQGEVTDTTDQTWCAKQIIYLASQINLARTELGHATLSQPSLYRSPD